LSEDPSFDHLCSWSAVLEQLRPILGTSEADVRIPSFLEALRRQYGWEVAEYWAADRYGYRIAYESHADMEQLHRLERESQAIVIPVEWVRIERWNLNPHLTGTLFKRVYWSASSRLSKVTIRAAMLAEARLSTQVAVPVPSQGPHQDIVMLFDTAARPATSEEVNALGVAVLLLGWASHSMPRPFLPMIEADVDTSRLDPDTRHLVGPHGAVRLTVYEWDLLQAFFTHEGRVLGFDEIARAVWDEPEGNVGRAVMYELVARVRRHLASVGDDYRLESVPGHGYILSGPKALEGSWQSRYFNLEAIL
jgi:DNA-binding winged helix-turn-helix (wHTH) protein